MIDVYNAGPRVKRVRFVMGLSLAAAAAGLWFGWELFQTYGLRPADGGRLAPLAERLTWGFGLAGLGLAFAFGMWVYGRNYVWAIGYDAAADRLYVRTLSFFGNRLASFPAASVTRSTHFPGRLQNLGGVSVNAPWHNVWVEGRRGPLILDGHGRVLDRALMDRLLSGGKRRRG